MKKKIGKYEYDFTEVFLKTKIIKILQILKKLRNFISLLGQGISFSSLAKKYGYESSETETLNLIGLLKII